MHAHLQTMHLQIINMDYDEVILIFPVKCIKVCSQQGTCKVIALNGLLPELRKCKFEQLVTQRAMHCWPT